ncbi:S9 family peptidase [bacterium]|nr:S9 family peptidase [bacterium]
MSEIIIVSLALCLLTGMAIAQAPKENHPFSIHDMLAMDRIGDPQVSPDGKLVLFSLRKTDMEANRGRTDLYLVGADGKDLRRLTSHPAGDFNARWSACGRAVIFLSTRSGSSQVWRIKINGGEAVQVTDLPLDVGSLTVNPKGRGFAISMEVFVGECIGCTKKILDEKAAAKTTAMIYESTFVRHWDTWKDGRRAHVFYYDCKTKNATDLMKAMKADCPTKPFGGPEEITFTPDGKGIVFAARDAGNGGEPWSTNFDLYHVPIDGSAAPQLLTAANKAWDTQPVFSPDGRTLAYLAMKRVNFEADRFYITLMDWQTKETRILAEEWDRSAGSVIWSKNSKTLFVTAGNIGQVSLFEINIKSEKVKTLVYDGHVRSPGLAGKRIIFGRDNLKSPVELYSVKTNGKDLQPVTTINAKTLAMARMGDYEQFSFKGWNDETVYAYVVKPVDFDPAKKYPVAFMIHGGPQGSFGNDFHYRWNPQAYTGAGYAAVMVDFHGSTGYGQDFTDAISGHWGDRPLEDLQKGLAAALDKYSWMDGDNVGALGASYGGYMINWIAGNWSDRFKCLINHDGNLDERMAYYDTEELWFPEWEHGGPQYENPEGYEKHNPVNYVKNWKTPMLVIHGALDYRVVDTQGIATFNALQRKGIPSKFIYFPDENHWVLQPHNSILWHNEVIGWLDKWCK